MRIEGEAPKQQQPILFPGAETMGRAAGYCYRGWFFGRFVAMCAEVPKPGISSFFLLPITPLNGKRGAEALQIVCAESWEHR